MTNFDRLRPINEAATSSTLAKAAPSLPQTKAFAKSAAPAHQYLKELAKPPDKLGTVTPTALIVIRQILLDEKE
jgi:hypothetical protein